MKKKIIIGVLSIFCSLALCMSVCVSLLGQKTATVNAEAAYTKTVNGVVYTFEQDFNNLTYSELGDVVNDAQLNTEAGRVITAHGNAGANYDVSKMAIKATDSEFTKSSGGLTFKFNTEGEWKAWNRAELAFGDLFIHIVCGSKSSNQTRLQFESYTFAKTGAIGTKNTIKVSTANNGSHRMILGTFFDESGSNFVMKDGWAEIRIHKNKCVAIDGDESAATGYWLTFSIVQPGSTEETIIHDGYLNHELATDTYDSVGLGFAPGIETSTMSVRNINIATAPVESANTKNINGVEYKFEQDFNKLVYSELGDVVNDVQMKTAEGHTVKAHAHAGSDYKVSDMSIKATDSAFTKSSGGLVFKFDTEGEWKAWNRAELAFGDLFIHIVCGSKSSNQTRLQFECYTFAKTGAIGSRNVIKVSTANNGNNRMILGTFFDESGSNFVMKDGWAEIRIHKNKCVAIDGDESAATGYWLTFSIVQPGATEETIIHDGYLNHELATDTYDSIGLGFAPGIETSTMTAKNPTTTLVMPEEVCSDIAEYNPKHAFADEYVMGKTISAVNARWEPNVDGNDLSNNNEKGSVGLEFRIKQEEGAMLAAVNNVANTTAWAILRIDLGTTAIVMDYRASFTDSNKEKIHFEVYNRSGSANTAVYKSNWGWSYVPGNEYVIRVTRQVITSASDNSHVTSIIRFYYGKVDETTGQPAVGWDDAPIWECNDNNPAWSAAISNNNVGVCLQKTVANSFDMTISSNKYVGVKTEIDGKETLNKVARGSDFVLADLSDEDTIHVGWSKGAEKYSESDFVAVNTKFEKMQQSDSNVYKALTFGAKADKTASIRFRQRVSDGNLLPKEISLKWGISITDPNGVADYFGGISLGYKLTASNGASTECETMNFTSNYESAYNYSVIQSNISSEFYTMKFVCQGYIEVNGVKYYTAAPDMENDGRSVDYVADAAAADLKAEAEGIYVNAIKNDNGEVIGYHYLTQEQYELIDSVASANA